jgi:protein phosphatase
MANRILDLDQWSEFGSPGFKLTAGSWSVRGRSREQNQDTEYISPSMKLFVVADGVGGHKLGQVASRFAVEAIAQTLVDTGLHSGNVTELAIRQALDEANRKVLGLSPTSQACGSPGTTVVVAVLAGRRMFVTGVGDSRAYLLRDGSLQLLTEDDTLPAYLERKGVISHEQALRHPGRNQLTRAIGMRDFRPDQSIQVLRLRADDRILLCTDGVSDVVPEEEIQLAMESELAPRLAAFELVQQACWNGARDDCTCVFIRVDRQSTSPTFTQQSGVTLLDRIRAMFVSAGPTTPTTVGGYRQVCDGHSITQSG